MRAIVTVVVTAVVVGAVALLYAWTGADNIAATEPHWGVTYNFIDLLKDRSIEAHSGGISAPDLGSAEMRQHAMPHYHGMCRHCHGAPGYAHSEFASGLYPYPPEIAEGHVQEEWNDAELYWIVKNGIKMTGMPAFGPTHSEKQLWGLVALTRQIPDMSRDEYRRAIQGAEGEAGHHGNGHKHSEKDEMPGHTYESENGHEADHDNHEHEEGHQH